MPKVYRVMQEENGKPMLGESATTLGARVPGDIRPDAARRVRPGIGGMSVSPSLRDLPIHRIPRRLQHLVPDAQGKDSNFVWIMGEGAFTASPVAGGLQLRLDPKNRRHGFVEPDAEMHLDDYSSALRATRSMWSIDEE
jgi:hypothetical protein